MADTVLYENQGKIVIITLNRPEVLNAINRQLAGELGEALVRFDHDEEAVAGIITGAGRAFCAGRDLKERAEDNTTGIQAKAIDSMSSEHPYMWPQTSKPLIAAINGYALAGGWSIAQICDLRLAAEDAKLGITESRVGLLPPFATILPRLIPMASVLELVFTAEPISAQRGWEIGFVNKVVPGERLIEEALTLAERIVANAPLAVRYFKELAYKSLDMKVSDINFLTLRMYDQLLLSDDSKEGPRAFAEKREPQWTGR